MVDFCPFQTKGMYLPTQTGRINKCAVDQCALFGSFEHWSSEQTEHCTCSLRTDVLFEVSLPSALSLLFPQRNSLRRPGPNPDSAEAEPGQDRSVYVRLGVVRWVSRVGAGELNNELTWHWPVDGCYSPKDRGWDWRKGRERLREMPEDSQVSPVHTGPGKSGNRWWFVGGSKGSFMLPYAITLLQTLLSSALILPCYLWCYTKQPVEGEWPFNSWGELVSLILLAEIGNEPNFQHFQFSFSFAFELTSALKYASRELWGEW